MDYEKLARKIVADILKDLSGRSGFDIITDIEEDIREEMYEELEAIVINILKRSNQDALQESRTK